MVRCNGQEEQCLLSSPGNDHCDHSQELSGACYNLVWMMNNSRSSAAYNSQED